MRADEADGGLHVPHRRVRARPPESSCARASGYKIEQPVSEHNQGSAVPPLWARASGYRNITLVRHTTLKHRAGHGLPVAPRNITLVRHTTLNHRVSHDLSIAPRNMRHTTLNHRASHDLSIAPRNITLVRHTTLKHRASHDLGGGAGRNRVRARPPDPCSGKPARRHNNLYAIHGVVGHTFFTSKADQGSVEEWGCPADGLTSGSTAHAVPRRGLQGVFNKQRVAVNTTVKPSAAVRPVNSP